MAAGKQTLEQYFKEHEEEYKKTFDLHEKKQLKDPSAEQLMQVMLYEVWQAVNKDLERETSKHEYESIKIKINANKRYFVTQKDKEIIREYKESKEATSAIPAITSFYQVASAHSLQKKSEAALSALNTLAQLDEYNIDKEPPLKFKRIFEFFVGLINFFSKNETLSLDSFADYKLATVLWRDLQFREDLRKQDDLKAKTFTKETSSPSIFSRMLKR